MIRLHKALAAAGIASRREAERWISEGRITVNGKVAQIGQSIKYDAVIKIDQKRIHLTPFESEILMLNKPVDFICSHEDPHHNKTIYDLLPDPKGGKWISIGRLDINTSGLLLLTNDGDIAHYLMHPKHRHKRVYRVRIRGEVSEENLAKLKKGIVLEDGYQAAFSEIKLCPEQSAGKNLWYQVALYEGKNRVVRKLWEAIGCQVSRLIRLQMGAFTLPRNLKVGECQALTAKQKKSIQNAMKEIR